MSMLLTYWFLMFSISSVILLTQLIPFPDSTFYSALVNPPI